jgi:subtilisin family serine protease
MKSRTFKLSLALVALACLAPFALDAVPRAEARQSEATLAPHVAGELLIKIDKTSARKSVRAMSDRLGARVVQELAQGQWQRLSLPEGVSVEEALRVYAETPGVSAAQPNYIYSIDNAPNDPRYSELYGMAKINAPAAWDSTTGSPSVVVAILDTGMKYTHEDLAANVWTNPGETGTDAQGHDKATNGWDDDFDGLVDDVHGYDFANNDPDPSDDNGHGTHCAGTIGAVGNNSTGVVGVNWNVSMIAVKTHDSSGNSTSAKVVAAFNYVTLLRTRGVNVRVTSNSWGGAPEAPAYDQALADALSSAAAADILNVFAAGNGNADTDAQPFYPASYKVPNLISVAASDQNDNRASFSNYGATSVDLAAPGVQILSTVPNSPNYASFSGTSMATPHVAGAAALLASFNPQLSAASLKASLLNSVDVLANWTSEPSTGKRLSLTGGRLNVARAISNQTACAYALGSPGARFTGEGGSGVSFNVNAQPNCDWTARSNATWIIVDSITPPSGNGSVSFSVAPNTTTEQRSGTVTAAGLTYTITQASRCSYTFANFPPTFPATGGAASVRMDTQEGCAWQATSNVPWVTITQGASGTGTGTISFTVAPNTNVRRNGAILIAIDSSLPVSQLGAPPTVQFAAATTNASEASPSAQIVVTRTGDTAGVSSVNVRTNDDARAIRCDDTTTAPGVAFARCDYATTVEMLLFGPGETQKTVNVPLIDDSFVEPNENVTLSLSNPSDATLGAQATTTLTITSDDAAGAQNPILNTDFFVRMQYLDFLSREPEAGQPWSAVLNNCAASDPSCDRISVSANFFRSDEFQLKGLFVFRFYKVAFGRLPLYNEIVLDMRAVTGATTAEVQAKKAAFTNAFAQRQEFKNSYDALTNQQFVNALMDRYTLQSITTTSPAAPDDSSLKITLTRADLIGRLSTATMTRAQVLRAIADSDQVSQAEFKPAFVAMQYFGYLRRDPEAQGYADWLRTINANPSDSRAMVSGFVNSPEYRLRFGQP